MLDWPNTSLGWSGKRKMEEIKINTILIFIRKEEARKHNPPDFEGCLPLCGNQVHTNYSVFPLELKSNPTHSIWPGAARTCAFVVCPLQWSIDRSSSLCKIWIWESLHLSMRLWNSNIIANVGALAIKSIIKIVALNKHKQKNTVLRRD